jgi:hypothetical protein
MTKITVIGAGEVFRNRYLTAEKEIHQKYEFEIADIVDVRPPSEIAIELELKGFYRLPHIHQLLDTSPEGLLTFLQQKNLFEHPVIIATPSPLHVPYGSRLLESGMTVCLEKPFAASRSQVIEFDKVIKKAGTDHLFLLGYYALEKGLASLVLARGSNIPPAYLKLLVPSVKPNQIAEIRASLGKVRCIRAVLLEGCGTAGQLEQRAWVLNPASGGNTVETFYHLVCLALPFLDDRQRIKIVNVELARHEKTAQWFYEKSGQQAAETLTAANLLTDEGIEARLVCAKYVPEGLHERWMEIKFDYGRAFADFEKGTLEIEGRELKFSLSLRHNIKYTTQFILFAEKLRMPQLLTEYKLFRDALVLTLDIRERGLINGLRKYNVEDLTRKRLEM